MKRNVKGELFGDYVRMIRSHKTVDWAGDLEPDDLALLAAHVEPNGWYPMESFERMGNAILKKIALGDLQAVRMWGRFSADQLRALHPALVAEGDPNETLLRFRVLRSTFFDFEAIVIAMLADGEAHIVIRYHMGPVAEEAASLQTMGFFERQLELAGATDVSGRFMKRAWTGDPHTLLELGWRMPR